MLQNCLKNNRRAALIVIAALIFAGAIVGAAAVLSRFLVKVQHETRITAKGYAEKQVRSDLGSFTVTVTVNTPEIALGFQKLQEQFNLVLERLKEYGFTETELESGGVQHEAIHEVLNNGTSGNRIHHHQLIRQVRICTSRVDLIAQNFSRLDTLLGSGIDLSVSAPEYFIRDPEAYKLELTAEATRSATARAQVMAGECGARLKELLGARLGVIQITRPASSEMSDYGAYDTTSVEKVIKIVVALEYSLR